MRIEENKNIVTEPQVTVTKCVEYYEQLLDVETNVDYAIACARDQMFFREVLKHLSQEMSDVHDLDIVEEQFYGVPQVW